MPICPDATILSGRQTDDGFTVSLLTGDDFAAVSTFYHDRLEQDGWTIVTDDETEMEGHPHLRLIADAESLSCTVDIAPAVGDDGTIRAHGIIIYVTEQEPED